jgi:small subunit ribosomal protein S20
MANHASALKRIRQTATRRLLNKYKHKTARNAIRELQALNDKKAASALLPKVVGMLDKLSKTNIIHKNKAANLKSKLTKHVNSLAKVKAKSAKAAPKVK